MKFWKIILAAIMSMLTFSITATAQIVTLNSIDGTIQMSGELVGFDGQTYTLSTNIGQIELSAAQVTCEGAGCPDLVAALKEFTIAGSASIANTLLPILIEAYALDRGGDLQINYGENGKTDYQILDPDGSIYSTITVAAGASSDGFLALESGAAIIGISSRLANAAEISRFEAAGFGDLPSSAQEKIIALDGIIPVVNRENPVATLSLDQIARIFSGDITNWSQVGGLNAPITLYRRAETADISQAFAALVLASSNRQFTDSANVLNTNLAVSDAVGRDKNGIGISSIVDQGNARALALRSVCGQISVASDFTIKTEEYPLSQRMYLYTRSGVLPDRAAELINFIATNISQEIAQNTGFVGQNVARVSLNQQGRRIANAIVAQTDADALGNLQTLLSTILDAERLSLTFRFANGTPELDNRAIGDIGRLAAMISAGDFEDRQILVLGFTDNIGSADENARLSQFRAEQVREAIILAVGPQNLGNVKITPIGYGNISPLGCNETPFGRQVNRRVEIWVH